MIPFFLVWGSFLNVLAFRLVTDRSIVSPRSFCPHCNSTIFWYDNIPVLSWLWLGGRCRFCKKSISLLYPFIEILTATLLSLLFMYIPSHYFLAYFIFFSALIVTIRSDTETMLISRLMTLFLVPIGFMLSFFNLLPITPIDSLLGALGGYFFLYFVGLIFQKCTGKSGIGAGDFDLLSFIGSFIGMTGCWISLTVGAFAGSLFGTGYLIFTREREAKIPFGPFLALGAIAYVFYQRQFLYYILMMQ